MQQARLSEAMEEERRRADRCVAATQACQLHAPAVLKSMQSGAHPVQFACHATHEGSNHIMSIKPALCDCRHHAPLLSMGSFSTFNI